LLVRPEFAETALFDYVYRAATGVRWRSADRSLLPEDVKGATPGRWFEIILASVHDELGIDLCIDVGTKWISIPPDVREEIVSLASQWAV
jgi:hypothetical protein